MQRLDADADAEPQLAVFAFVTVISHLPDPAAAGFPTGSLTRTAVNRPSCKVCS